MSLSAKYENAHHPQKINHSFEVNFLTVHYVFETQSKPRDEWALFISKILYSCLLYEKKQHNKSSK